LLLFRDGNQTRTRLVPGEPAPFITQMGVENGLKMGKGRVLEKRVRVRVRVRVQSSSAPNPYPPRTRFSITIKKKFPHKPPFSLALLEQFWAGPISVCPS